MQYREQRIEIVRHLAASAGRQAGLDILQHGHAGKDHPPLRHVGDAAFHALMGFQFRHVLAVHANLPAPLRQDAHQALEQGGLAHAVAAHHCDDFLLRHVEVELVENLALAVAGSEVADLEHVCHSNIGGAHGAPYDLIPGCRVRRAHRFVAMAINAPDTPR
ncbi:hypothetical protein N619_27240 [Ectopseudomonas oleovorans]|nr:hypothetical protein N619_27240 [Pseudomonas oleovorans]